MTDTFTPQYASEREMKKATIALLGVLHGDDEGTDATVDAIIDFVPDDQAEALQFVVVLSQFALTALDFLARDMDPPMTVPEFLEVINLIIQDSDPE